MICPICNGNLEENGMLLICYGECGSTFNLNYFGMCNPGDEEVTEEGSESEEFLEKYGKRIRKFKYGEKLLDAKAKGDEK